MRQIGLDKIVYGSDGQPPNHPTAQHWLQTWGKLPLSEDEFGKIAVNVAPYLQAGCGVRASCTRPLSLRLGDHRCPPSWLRP